MKKSVSLVEFSTTPTVSVMKSKTGENVAGDGKDQPEQANSRVNAALAQLSAQDAQGSNSNGNNQNNAQQGNGDEGRGIFTLE